MKKLFILWTVFASACSNRNSEKDLKTVEIEIVEALNYKEGFMFLDSVEKEYLKTLPIISLDSNKLNFETIVAASLPLTSKLYQHHPVSNRNGTLWVKEGATSFYVASHIEEDTLTLLKMDSIIVNSALFRKRYTRIWNIYDGIRYISFLSQSKKITLPDSTITSLEIQDRDFIDSTRLQSLIGGGYYDGKTTVRITLDSAELKRVKTIFGDKKPLWCNIRLNGKIYLSAEITNSDNIGNGLFVNDFNETEIDSLKTYYPGRFLQL